MVPKILIGGTGRAGTTFLINLLAALDYDVRLDSRKMYYPKLRAGGERKIAFHLDSEPDDVIRQRIADGPRVIKGPGWMLILKALLQRELIKVEHLIIPFRDLELAARSRLDVGLDWIVNDDLEGEERVIDQMNVLASVLGYSIEVAMLFEVPTTIMKFPAFVQNEDYCYQKLSRCFEMDRQRFGKEFGRLANPEQIKWT